MRRHWTRTREYLLRGVWLREPERGWRGLPLYLLRTGILVAETSWNKELFVRAAALSFKVAFAIVPLLAVLLGLIKAFGGLEEQKLKPFLEGILQYVVPPGWTQQIYPKVNEIVARLDAATIGAVGFAVLFYTSISLLSTIEQAFNVIWGVRRLRTILRRITVYWTLLTIGPLVLVISVTASGFITSHAAYQWFQRTIPGFSDVVLVVVPLVLVWIVFTGMYLIMPNTKVPFLAALTGGMVAGTAFQVGTRLWMLFNQQIAGPYAVYGAIAAIPITLLYFYFSWVIILFGAEVAFATQHVRTYRREMEAPRLSQAFKEKLGLRLMVEVAGRFTRGEAPASAEGMAQALQVPVRACHEVLFQLTGGKLLVEMVDGQNATYLPAEDLDRVTVKRVMDALRRSGTEPPIQGDGVGDRVGSVLEEADRAMSAHLDRMTVKDLLGEGKAGENRES